MCVCLPSSGVLHHSTICNVLTFVYVLGRCANIYDCMSVKGRTSNSKKTPFHTLLKQALSPPRSLSHTQTHKLHTCMQTCPRVFSRFEPAPGELVHSDTPWLHRFLTCFAVSFLDHTLHFSIVWFRQTVGHLDIFLYMACEYLCMTQ